MVASAEAVGRTACAEDESGEIKLRNNVIKRAEE
jgi:hypothetical protein